MRLLLAITLTLFAARLCAAPGDLDTGFGVNGKVITAIGQRAKANAVIQQSDGKLVTAGYSLNLANIGYGNFLLVRYNINGTLDTSFNGIGSVSTDIGTNGAEDTANSLIQQADGKLVAAGSSGNNPALARYNSDGSLDATFNGTGKVTTIIGGAIQSVIQQSDGKLVAVSYYNGQGSVVRYNSNGSLDNTFSGTGHITTSMTYARSVIQQSDGKLVVAGYSGSSFALARYNNNGSLDATFNGIGQQTTPFAGTSGAWSVIQQADGKLVVTGYGSPVGGNGNNDFVSVRYHSNGALDTAFNGTGIVTTSVTIYDDVAGSIIQQFDGKLVVFGITSYDGGVLVRYNSNGSMDTTFGNSGYRFNTYLDIAAALIQQADGRLVVAGSICTFNISGSCGARSIVLTRYESRQSTVAQTITVTTPAPASAALNSAFPVVATASSGLAVAVTVSGGCSIAGSIVTMTSSTTACTVNYNQAGNANYLAATEVTSVTNAAQATQTISVTTPAPASAALNSTFPVAATASSGLPVAITVSGGCTMTGGTVTMTSSTTACTVNYDQAGDASYFAATQVTSNTAATLPAQLITVTTPAPAFAAITTTFPVAATASSGLLVAITASGGCSGVGTGNATITMLGTDCVVSFNQSGNASYSAAPLVLNYTYAPGAIYPLDGTHQGAGFTQQLQVR